MKDKLIIITLSLLLWGCNQPQNTTAQNTENNNDKTYAIAFYNLENLFDTERDTSINDSEYTPQSAKQWDKEKYNKKLDNLSYVISLLGKDKCAEGAAIVGVAEVENKKVLQDLANHSNIATINYQIVHYDSPDPRGIDVGFLYNPKLFKVISSERHKFSYPSNTRYNTRDILLVNGTMNGEAFHILVNHWPSRRGENSEELRIHAAKQCKSISDSIYRTNNNAKIIIMGDLNDNPTNTSCRTILKAKQHQKDVKKGGLYNTMWNLYAEGLGSARYRNTWDLFDQIIVSESLTGNKQAGLKFQEAEIFNKDFLFQQSGQYKGHPLRTFSGNTFLNGYSDHFPTIIYLK
ncbi:endonuclease/exonuclease/phosphatase family protein [Dysgonomonas sp. 520]|uniref:endonuclease/exonuclease/phosphatase family protein n=1 Tax=Dysgonomonas sp. 520 TaxID=2302931 RepID=UPI0013D8A19A|nr:endonuclease/exonuclease/phosphatase family protein [Dysgonomonas sp. 520]NDW09913.1 endonuclease/exonuclease/phosphatase family protein [Dysgonomonas sp. 520]